MGKLMQNMFLGFLCLMAASFGMSNASGAKMQPSEKIENLTGQKEMQMNHENHTPQYLYKIVSPEEWQDSLLKNQVVTSPLDKNFIHLATENQLAHVVQKFWNDKSHIILKLDSKKMTGRLIYETNPGGTTQYYHLYEGKIPLDAVVVRP
jgi:uncharacterized protein (DUF952 family)